MICHAAALRVGPAAGMIVNACSGGGQQLNDDTILLMRTKSNRAASQSFKTLFACIVTINYCIGSTTFSADLRMLKAWLKCREGALTAESMVS
jgi:hypothetical protein